MRKIFFDADGRLRNGWWIGVFLVFFAVSTLAYTPVSRAIQALGVDKKWLEPLPVLFLLVATWGCTRLRRERLSSIGLVLDRRWAREALLGVALGGGSLALAAGLIWAIGGVHFELDPARSLAGLGYGLFLFTGVAFLEEILFRGFVFQRLVAGIGAWPAQLAMAALFALAHWSNPGMEGVTKVMATIDIALAAVMLGLAWQRTRSLALPIGLHLGWNWVQGYCFGFGVSGMDLTGWLHPVFDDLPVWVTGGEFGPEASVFGIVADVVMLAVVWKWPVARPTVVAAPAIDLPAGDVEPA